MALPMLRGCFRLPSTFSFTRLYINESIILNRFGKTRLPPSTVVRPYSSDRGGQKQKQKVVVVGIPNPFIWFRTRIYYFLIRAYFDKEFNIEEFTEGAKQLIGKLEEKCNLLPSSYKKALSADPDEIMYTTPGDVGIYYDDNGRKFVSILMRFWYLTSTRLPNDNLEGTRVFQVSIGGEGEAESKRLLTANYEFQREFTKGVPPDWTITRIEHSKLLD
ncbi:m-AAA protease-interacting protein 1, mitochondrial isoform X2 [Siniperca chuatsi]|uniref:m-AAA protease-interacting protein 1, mitochondrial isoform X2 n=1 Tax=Siniperca chuatsi TaxID=119488 RepID=UPI001CE07360|nr:m-AAA protease-interacting protein 1, mitochondrial isoform X2 [Siniperca chuatsi]